MNNLLGIPWVFGSATAEAKLPSPIIIECKQFQNAVAKMAAEFVWLGMSTIKFYY